MNFKLPTNFQSSGQSKYWMFSSGLPPQNQTTPFFLVYSIGCLVLLHPLFPSFSLFIYFFLFFYFFKFDLILVFEPWEKPFQNSSHALDYFWTYWEKIENFRLQISWFFIIHFCDWGGFEVILVGWRTSMKIHEISGWNEVYPANTIFNFASSMNCTSHMGIQWA
jgi:hypothetical protein